MSDERTIFRRRRKSASFTQIANTPLRDENLSLEAVGLLACILSLPENWSFNRSWARNRFKLGREKMDRIIKELKDAQYVLYEQDRDEFGRLSRSSYVFTDEPGQFDEEEPSPGNPYSGGQPLLAEPSHGNPDSGKTGPILRETSLEIKIKEKRERASDAKPHRARALKPASAAPVERPGGPAVDWMSRLIWSADPRKRGWLPNYGRRPKEDGCEVPSGVLQEYERKYGAWRERGGYGR